MLEVPAPWGSYDDRRISRHYPDVMNDGSLATSIRNHLLELGSNVVVTGFHETLDSGSRWYASASSSARSAECAMALHERQFLLKLSNEHLTAAQGATDQLSLIAPVIHRWLADEVDISELCNDYAFLILNEWALKWQQLSEDQRVALAWQELLNYIEAERLSGGECIRRQQQLVAAASRHPSLCKLYPVLSHDVLHFSDRVNGDWKQYPYVEPLSGASGNIVYRVFDRNGVLLDSVEAKDALSLIVANLPKT